MKTLIPRLLAVLLLLPTLTPLVRGEGRVVREFVHDDFRKTLGPAINGFGPKRPAGITITQGGDNVLIDVTQAPVGGERHTLTILSLDAPGITQTRYFILGDVSYENVEGDAYLEMWSDFPDGGHYFSRTLGDAPGPMMKLMGTSAKRPFMLPFTSDVGQVPSKLTVNVVMPGKGKVTLSRVRLVENGEPATAPTLEQRMRQRRETARSRGGTPTSAAAGMVNDLNTLDGDVLALRDPLKHPRLAEEALKQAPAATATTRDSPAVGGPTPLTGLPPDVAAAVRRQFSDDLVAAIKRRDFIQGLLDWANSHLEAGEKQAYLENKLITLSEAKSEYEQHLQGLDRRIETLKTALAEPLPIAAATPPAPPTGIIAWLDRHSAYLFAGLVVLMLLAMIPLQLLMKTGRGRAVVLGFFGLMLAGGVGQLFAAGVALGMGRPADAWVTLLGCAAILIVCGAMMLRQARAHYAGFELRKLRAMDVG